MATAIATVCTGTATAVTVGGIDLGPADSGSWSPGPAVPPDGPPPPTPEGYQLGGPCRAGGDTPGHWGWVHLDGGNAAHYGTHWLFTCLSN